MSNRSRQGNENDMDTGHEQSSSIFTDYFSYIQFTEPPVQYHRWCYLAVLSAIIERRAHLPLGHFRIFPNLYIMLLGEPAARKSTSIKLAKKLLATTGYNTFSADKTSKEKFLLDLEGKETDDEYLDGPVGKKNKIDVVTADNLWGANSDQSPRQVFIVADEFNEFAGTGNLEFFTTLGNLWDYDNPDGCFSQRLKNSRSVSIYQPTITLLAGNTPELFAKAFPPEAIGGGFLSRLILVHGERSGRKITFPPEPDGRLGEKLAGHLGQLQLFSPGKVELSEGARKLLDRIYQEGKELNDIRFKGYSNRRFVQLLKLCTILTVAAFEARVSEETVLFASTILSHAELLMPKAMGEFGKGKNSDTTNKLMDILDRTLRPLSITDLWAQVHNDLGSTRELVEIMSGLVQAGKAQLVQGKGGFLPRKQVRSKIEFVDWSLLTKEERDQIL